MGRTKRQARSAFNPLTTSSPAPAHVVQELGERSYASVGYEGSRREGKRRRLNTDNEESLEAEFGLPTPAKSSQFPPSSKPSRTSRLSDIQLDVAPEPTSVSSATRGRKKRAQQGKLDFSNHIGIKLAESEKENNGSGSDSSSEDDEIGTMRTKTPARAAKPDHGILQSQQRRRQLDKAGSEDELLSSTNTTPKKSSALKRLRKGTRTAPVEPRTQKAMKQLDSEEDEDENPSASKRRVSNVDVDFAESESSGDDAPALYSSPSKKRRANAQKSYQEDDFVVLSDSDNDVVEVDIVPDRLKSKPKSGRLSRHRRRPTSDDEEEEEKEVEEPRRKRRLKRQPRTLDEREQEDLDEDLEFLQSSPPGADAKPRARKVDQRLEALEALKRKRAGLDSGPSSSTTRTSGANGRGPFIVDSSEEENAAEDEVDEDAEWEEAAAARRRAFDDKDDGDDWIVEDDEDEPLGAPDDIEIELPIYLTGVARMKPKELFRYAVEWMVQKKLNPAYNQEQEKYAVTFKKLNDEVKGLAGSKFTSSAWTRDFTISLQVRPGIELVELGDLRSELELVKCQACNRSGHPATYRIEFTGRPYHPDTLEPIEQDGDSDSDDRDSDDSTTSREEYDAKGRLVPPSSRTYSVGRYCKDNAMTAHALEHWKYQLNSWIVDWLENEGHLTNEKIVRRDRWDEPRRRKYARKVVEQMDEIGQIKTLWRQFRDEVDVARERESGWRGVQEREF